MSDLKKNIFFCFLTFMLYNKFVNVGSCHFMLWISSGFFSTQPLVLIDQITNASQAYVLKYLNLQVLKVIPKPKVFVQPGPCTTVGFCSDGLYCYWLWCPTLVQDKNAKNINVNVCTYVVEVKKN